MAKEKKNVSYDSLIKELIKDIKEGDCVSIYNPNSYIVGCNWVFGVWLNNKFVHCSTCGTPQYVSDINKFDITKNTVYSICDNKVEVLYKPKTYTIKDLSTNELKVYISFKELRKENSQATITDMWETFWEVAGASYESYQSMLIKKIYAIYDYEKSMNI